MINCYLRLSATEKYRLYQIQDYLINYSLRLSDMEIGDMENFWKFIHLKAYAPPGVIVLYDIIKANHTVFYTKYLIS
jgi:hypothetical protein